MSGEEEIRVALKVAYDGTNYFGFQRQPGRVTVEGALVTALDKVGAISSPRECGYRSSSRTDRGVSALGNVISFRTSFPLRSICSAINSELEDIWAYSIARVPDDFNPRAARQRWYRYYLPKDGQDLTVMKALAERFIGIHDFSSYATKADRNPMRKIDSIDISDEGLFHALDFRAESFLWNMIRRIVWVMNEGSTGRLDLASIGPEAKKKLIRIGLSPPEYLLLMDVDCGVEFELDERARIRIKRMAERMMKSHSMNLIFSEHVRDLSLRGL
ncbi:MAG: tRNA pseudouridine(38-40) synthase TruA [Candidatus Thermoplasmatota archaeon]|nr:tRNA pseudouridine(38-40) synthase TruA [Candidatus Thermoplasmatota archaeon]